MKREKFKLKELEIKSFITSKESVNKKTIKGGGDSNTCSFNGECRETGFKCLETTTATGDIAGGTV